MEDFEIGLTALLCPSCGYQDSLTPVKEYTVRNDYYNAEFLHGQGCSAYQNRLRIQFERLLEQNFTTAEREILNEIYVGLEF